MLWIFRINAVLVSSQWVLSLSMCSIFGVDHYGPFELYPGWRRMAIRRLSILITVVHRFANNTATIKSRTAD